MSPRQSGDDTAVFLAVCAAGSFAAAAPRLALTPSAVAKAVARIEARLQVRLFHRTTRSLVPTPEALVYREACLAARHHLERVEADLALLASEPAGPLRVSLPPLLGTRVVAPALYALCRQWPRLRLAVTLSTQAVAMPGQDCDLALRIGALPDLPGLVARGVGEQRIMLCAARHYLAERAAPQTPADLAGHDLIATARADGLVPWHLLGPEGERTTVQPEAQLALDGGMLSLDAIRAGHGIGQVPEWLAREDLASGALVAVLPGQVLGHLPVHLLWPAGPTMLPRLRVAIDAMAQATRAVLAPPAPA